MESTTNFFNPPTREQQKEEESVYRWKRVLPLGDEVLPELSGHTCIADR